MLQEQNWPFTTDLIPYASRGTQIMIYERNADSVMCQWIAVRINFGVNQFFAWYKRLGSHNPFLTHI